jgi:hypothetical protein
MPCYEGKVIILPDEGVFHSQVWRKCMKSCRRNVLKLMDILDLFLPAVFLYKLP